MSSVCPRHGWGRPLAADDLSADRTCSEAGDAALRVSAVWRRGPRNVRASIELIPCGPRHLITQPTQDRHRWVCSGFKVLRSPQAHRSPLGSIALTGTHRSHSLLHCARVLREEQHAPARALARPRVYGSALLCPLAAGQRHVHTHRLPRRRGVPDIRAGRTCGLAGSGQAAGGHHSGDSDHQPPRRDGRRGWAREEMGCEVRGTAGDDIITPLWGHHGTRTLRELEELENKFTHSRTRR